MLRPLTMRTLRSILLLSLALACAAGTQAQRPELNTQADVEKHVHDVLTADKAHGRLAELAVALGLRGSFTFDLTVGDKGEAETVFPIASTIERVEDRNRLKDLLKSMRFGCKLPKNKRFKVRETLDFP